MSKITDFVGGYPNWVVVQFKNSLWYMLLWSATLYFAGVFTGPMIPKINTVVVKIANKFGA